MAFDNRIAYEAEQAAQLKVPKPAWSAGAAFMIGGIASQFTIAAYVVLSGAFGFEAGWIGAAAFSAIAGYVYFRSENRRFQAEYEWQLERLKKNEKPSK